MRLETTESVYYTRMHKLVLSTLTVLVLAVTTSAQQPDPISAAAAALGADTIKSLQFTGSGASFNVGQPYEAGGAWPRLNVESYTAVVDYGGPTAPGDRPHGSQPAAARRRTVHWPAAPGAGAQRQQRVERATACRRRTAAGDTTGTAARGRGRSRRTEVVRVVDAARLRQSRGCEQGHIATLGRLDRSHVYAGWQISCGRQAHAQNQVERVQTWIDNPVLGDMLVETTYSGYRDFGGVSFPARIQQSQGGHPTLELTISAVVKNPSLDLAVPESVNKPVAPIQVASEEVAPGVHYLTGGSHHSVAIGMRDHVVVVEGPQSEARSLAVIAKTKELFPDKPIRYVVNTHVHFDHSGGLRPFVDEGATVVTHRSNQSFFEKAWAAPRTINPDRLAQSKKRARFQAVGDRGQLTDGSRTIDLHIVPTRHNSGILAVYLPAEKIVMQADRSRRCRPMHRRRQRPTRFRSNSPTR